MSVPHLPCYTPWMGVRGQMLPCVCGKCYPRISFALFQYWYENALCEYMLYIIAILFCWTLQLQMCSARIECRIATRAGKIPPFHHRLWVDLLTTFVSWRQRLLSVLGPRPKTRFRAALFPGWTSLECRWTDVYCSGRVETETGLLSSPGSWILAAHILSHAVLVTVWRNEKFQEY